MKKVKNIIIKQADINNFLLFIKSISSTTLVAKQYTPES